MAAPVLTRNDRRVRVLHRRQSSPIQGQRCSLHKEKGRENNPQKPLVPSSLSANRGRLAIQSAVEIVKETKD